ncbi:MAG: hypothetical protein JSV58_01755 [Candidatus Bathyarchaeota archaeon]|nr:MAG: hypothetical protein JSV58_01755 [Candidatus Bathyarchaeota archaeon]
MNLGFDIDGVISDFVAYFKTVAQKHYNLTLDEADIYCHDLDFVLGISREERNKLVRETLLGNLQLMKGAKETLTKLSLEGHKIVILTARFDDLVTVTEEWLQEKGIPYTQLIQSKQGEKYLADVNLDMVVEDDLEDAIAWSKRVKNVLLYDHPWNQSLNIKGLFKRIYSWNNIRAEIQKLEKESSKTPMDREV